MRIAYRKCLETPFQFLPKTPYWAMTGNGTRQKVVGLNYVKKFISEGYDFVSQLPEDKAIVKLPF